MPSETRNVTVELLQQWHSTWKQAAELLPGYNDRSLCALRHSARQSVAELQSTLALQETAERPAVPEPPCHACGRGYKCLEPECPNATPDPQWAVAPLPTQVAPAAQQGAVSDGVWEALQRLIENAATLGPASREDALLVAKWRGRLLLASPPAPQPAARMPQELLEVQRAVRDYHFALDTRQHGGTAAHKALDAIQEALGMPWTQGREARRRLSRPLGGTEE